jgi:two-component system, chemotaxis family, protein-glutamate methylesterase/glutaminase
MAVPFRLRPRPNAHKRLVSSRLVVVGASAGGVEALKQLTRDLPADLPAAVVVVLHVSSEAPSVLAEIIGRAGNLRARTAQDGDVLEDGTVYVAPPDCHVLVRGDRLEVVRGPRENGHRPAVDPLFRSAAVSRGVDVVAVVLTGVLDDGSAGAVAVSRRGGKVIVQDPDDAAFQDMPRNAIADDSPEAVLPIREIGACIARLVREPAIAAVGGGGAVDELETRYAALDRDAISRPHPPGDLSPYSCPDCGGVMTEIDDEAIIRFRCRVGHAHTAETLLDAQEEEMEQAFFTALRALEERADLSRRFARRLRRNDLLERAARAEASAANDERLADVVRNVLTRPAEAGQPARAAAE